jgi:hypothetical protein
VLIRQADFSDVYGENGVI